MENKKIKKLRKQKDLSQIEVAIQAGISDRQFRRLEIEGKTPNVKTAIKIANILGTTVEELFP